MIYSKELKMGKASKARVFMSGRSQAVRIPAEFRFTTDEVYVRRDPQSGDLILSQAPGEWDEIYAALDQAGVPEDFLADRKQGPPQVRS
jgi:antitoxin VapB